MTSELGQQRIAIYIYIDQYLKKNNQAMKFG